MEDEAIVQLIWDRQEQGLEELGRKYNNYCYCISERIVQNAEDAKECVNDTWLRVWNAIPPHRPKGLSGFLAKIVRNLSLNRYRDLHAGKRGGANVNLALGELEECLSDGKSVEEHMEQELLTQAIERFLRKQPERNRVIFLQRYFYLVSIKEIALTLDMKEGTVKSVLSRMRAQLRVCLEKEAIYL